MARPRMQKGALAQLAQPGAQIELRVIPNARQEGIEHGPEGLRISTTATPEGGKANRAVQKLLAHALGIAPSRLRLTAGASSRVKRFQID